MPKVVRTLLARDDLLGIWMYIASDNVAAADRTLDRIDEVIRHLSAHPLLGEGQDHLRVGLRRFVVGNYLVFYEPTADGIRVIRVLHGARRWEDEMEV